MNGLDSVSHDSTSVTEIREKRSENLIRLQTKLDIPVLKRRVDLRVRTCMEQKAKWVERGRCPEVSYMKLTVFFLSHHLMIMLIPFIPSTLEAAGLR